MGQKNPSTSRPKDSVETFPETSQSCRYQRRFMKRLYSGYSTTNFRVASPTVMKYTP